jgi:hypothetical protein
MCSNQHSVLRQVRIFLNEPSHEVIPGCPHPLWPSLAHPHISSSPSPLLLLWSRLRRRICDLKWRRLGSGRVARPGGLYICALDLDRDSVGPFKVRAGNQARRRSQAGRATKASNEWAGFVSLGHGLYMGYALLRTTKKTLSMAVRWGSRQNVIGLLRNYGISLMGGNTCN